MAQALSLPVKLVEGRELMPHRCERLSCHICPMRGKDRVPGGPVLEVDLTAFLLLQMSNVARLAVVVAFKDEYIVTSNGHDQANTPVV